MFSQHLAAYDVLQPEADPLSKPATNIFLVPRASGARQAGEILHRRDPLPRSTITGKNSWAGRAGVAYPDSPVFERKCRSMGFLCTHLCDERWCSATVIPEVGGLAVCVASSAGTRRTHVSAGVISVAMRRSVPVRLRSKSFESRRQKEGNEPYADSPADIWPTSGWV